METDIYLTKLINTLIESAKNAGRSSEKYHENVQDVANCVIADNDLRIVERDKQELLDYIRFIL